KVNLNVPPRGESAPESKAPCSPTTRAAVGEPLRNVTVVPGGTVTSCGEAPRDESVTTTGRTFAAAPASVGGSAARQASAAIAAPLASLPTIPSTFPTSAAQLYHAAGGLLLLLSMILHTIGTGGKPLRHFLDE